MTKQSDRALQIAISDKSLQAYLQQNPFGIGLNPELNNAALATLRHCLRLRPEAASSQLHSADPDAPDLTTEEVRRIQDVFKQVNLPHSQQQWAWRALAWKICRIPRDAKTVLSIGCAGGTELVLIRGLLPDAAVTAVDFEDVMPQAMKTVLGARFFQGHFNDFLAQNRGQFNVVFCNHVLEHLYEPEVTLELIRNSLKPGGILLAGLPIEGSPDGLFTEPMRRMAAKPSALHILDVGVLDAGHGWKTNPDDLKATLEKEGFTPVEVCLRRVNGGQGPALVRAVGRALYFSSFGLARWFLKRFPSEAIPDMALRCFLAAERRCWFGANRLKNRFAKEVLVRAQATL